ncbi:MAG: hypothetical protein AABY14_05005 [Nanoarchaeota archaeon]
MAKKNIPPGTVHFERWVPTPPAHIRYTGIWDMEDLYNSLADWFRYKKYKFKEELYEHRQPTAFGRGRIYLGIREKGK